MAGDLLCLMGLPNTAYLSLLLIARCPKGKGRVGPFPFSPFPIPVFSPHPSGSALSSLLPARRGWVGQGQTELSLSPGLYELALM